MDHAGGKKIKAQRRLGRQDIERYRNNYLGEQDGIALCHALAAAEKDARRAEIFEKLAAVSVCIDKREDIWKS